VLQAAGGGLSSTGGRLLTQNSPGVPGLAETFDLFGGLEIVFQVTALTAGGAWGDEGTRIPGLRDHNSESPARIIPAA
jgi:hypothetical protein